MDKIRTSTPVDIPVDPITGGANVLRHKPEDDRKIVDKDGDPLTGPLGDTTAKPYENEG